MARGINSAFQGQLNAGTYSYAVGVDMAFTNGLVPLTNYSTNLAFQNTDYFGLGSLLTVGSVNENTDLGISGLSITLSGLDTIIVSRMRDTEIQGVDVNAYLFLINSSGQVADSHLYFKGVIDNMTYVQNRETVTISLTCENFLVRFADVLNRRYTVEDQKINYPNDLGLDYVEDISEQEIIWGQ